MLLENIYPILIGNFKFLRGYTYEFDAKNIEKIESEYVLYRVKLKQIFK